MNIQLLLLFIIILVLGFFMKNTTSRTQPQTIQSDTPLKVIGWIPFWDQAEAFNSFSSHKELFDSIGLFWYSCSPDGTVAVYHNAIVDPYIISFAHKNKVKVFATVANLSDNTEKETWDPNCVDTILSSKQKRDEHISHLVDLVVKNDFDGLAIDYEGLPASQKDNFSEFIETLARQLHQKGKLLGVTIHPKTSENNPSEDNGSHAQDLQRIAKAADSLYYMTYLEHGDFSDPGPPGSIGWIKQVLQYSIDDLHIPKEKIYLGVGLMGVTWHQRPDETYEGESNDNTFNAVLSVTQSKGISPTWDPISQTPFFNYQDNGGNHLVWFENSHSIAVRVAYAKELGIKGIAFWRLGGEDQGIWNVLKNNQ